MSGVDTKLLRAAVVLAEELNFCRAADKLHICQSTLSKQIIALEDFLGYELFSETVGGSQQHRQVTNLSLKRAFRCCIRNERFSYPVRQIVIARLHSTSESRPTLIPTS